MATAAMPSLPEDTIRLLDALTTRDDRAFAQLVREFTPMIRRVLEATCRTIQIDAGEELVDDCLQEVWWRMYRAGRNVDPTRSVKPWLRTIAKNVLRDMVRARRQEAQRVQRWPVGEDGPVQFADDRPSSRADYAFEEREAYESAITQAAMLPDHYQTILRLRASRGGRCYADIAATLGIPVGTVKSRLARARQAWRQRRGE